MTIIGSNNVFINEQFIKAYITIENGKITNISNHSDICDHFYDDYKILPGLIDIHCHGYNGLSCNQANKDGLLNWIHNLPKEGCTSFLASTSTAKEEDLLKSFSIFSDFAKKKLDGAELLGIHVEGPYISFEKAGAQDKYSIRKPSVEEIQKWQEAADGNIKLCCIAPEMDNNHEMIKYCSKNNIKVSIGHTNASFEECMQAIHDGASNFTHTFNAMTQLGHRAPGAVGAAMISQNCFSELIADGVHVHPAACLILAKCKGKDKLILVTDSVSLKGFDPGTYIDGERKVIVTPEGIIKKTDGTLAGSANCMISILRNSIKNIGINEITAINAATKNPCELLGIKNKGQIKSGYDADLIVVDSNYNLIQTFCLGKQFL